jgi:hypothetical protein
LGALKIPVKANYLTQYHLFIAVFELASDSVGDEAVTPILVPAY